MKTSIATERILIFSPQIELDDAKYTAWQKKVDAFGAVNKMVSFLSKPKDDDFELVYTESRYQPFWHVVGDARYVYDRKNQYQWPVSGKEVQRVTVEGTEYEVINGKVNVHAVDHCVQEQHEEVFVNGITGEKDVHLEKYLSFSSSTTTKEELERLSLEKNIIVPPEARVSAIVREVMANGVKVIQADEIFEETIDLKQVDLYYHPVFAFQYRWISKNKESIVEVDGLTGKVTVGNQTFKKYLGKALDKDFLFDVGADAAGMFIPGGSIAVKVAKKVIESKRK